MTTLNKNISVLSQLSLECLKNHFRINSKQPRSTSTVSLVGIDRNRSDILSQSIWREIQSIASTGAEGIAVTIGAFGWTSHALRPELQDIYPGQACLCITYPNQKMPLAALNIYIRESTLAGYRNEACMVEDGIVSMIGDVYRFLKGKLGLEDAIRLVSSDFISIRWIPSDFDVNSVNIPKMAEALECGVPYEDVFAEYSHI